MTAADEGRHVPAGTGPWRETWGADFATADGALGGYLELTVWPREGRTWCWAALVGHGRPLVSVVEHDIGALRGPGLDVRAEGLWADQVCEAPLEHWTIGLEAFGVALDDPLDALGHGRGERTPLGLDLEWESVRADVEPLVGGYELPCEVHGEVLVADERLGLADGWGRRRHEWGPPRPTGARSWGRSAAGHWSAPGEVALTAAHAAPVAFPGGHLVRQLGRVPHGDHAGPAWTGRVEPVGPGGGAVAG